MTIGDNKKAIVGTMAGDNSKGENNKGKDKEFSRLNCINWTNSVKFKLAPEEKEIFCYMWHKMESFYHNNGWFFWTFDQITDELNISHKRFKTSFSVLSKLGLIEKEKRQVNKGSYKTNKNFYRLNLTSLANSEILAAIFKPDHVSEYQSEFAALAIKTKYYDYKLNNEAGIIKMTNKNVNFLEHYQTEIENNPDHHFLPLYKRFFHYISTANNPFSRPLVEISSLPGQPTLPDLNKIFKEADQREVDFWIIFNKYVEYLDNQKAKKVKSFTMQLFKWVQSEKKPKTTYDSYFDNWDTSEERKQERKMVWGRDSIYETMFKR